MYHHRHKTLQIANNHAQPTCYWISTLNADHVFQVSLQSVSKNVQEKENPCTT